MKNDRGITLTILIITVVVLIIIAGLVINYGMDTFRNSKVVKFETYMKLIQKKVDIILENGTDYTELGQSLTDNQKAKLQNIVSKISVETNDVNDLSLRYFSPQDIENEFGIAEVEDDIVINFSNREVISLKGVEKNGSICYTENDLHK